MTDPTKPIDAPIYRGMSRAALDAAYNNSAAVADSERWLERWRRRSDEVRGVPGARLDVAYGPKQRTRLDYFPAGRPGAPLFVFLHGGYWQRNAKEMFAFIAEGPRQRGIDVAVVGYTLAPAARLSEIVREVSDALSFLHANAAVFGFDRRALCVGGWSAGGHLAAASCGHPAVQSALAISGIFDLEPIALPELQRQSTSFHDIAGALGVAMALHVLPGHHHYSILDELARPDGALTGELLRLVAR
jgi:arylformamidase